MILFCTFGMSNRLMVYFVSRDMTNRLSGKNKILLITFNLQKQLLDILIGHALLIAYTERSSFTGRKR